MKIYHVKKPYKLDITYDESVLVIHYRRKLFKQSTLKDYELSLKKLQSVRFFEATKRQGHLRLVYQEVDQPAQNIVLSFRTRDNLHMRQLYSALKQKIADLNQSDEVDFVQTGNLIMAYLKMRDDGLMTNDEFEAKKKRILGLE